MNTPNMAATADPREPAPKRLEHRRRWVRGDVRCLQCARLLGRLLGSVGVSQADVSRRTITFLAYHPLLPVGPIEPNLGRSHYPCSVCHGSGALDGVEDFVTSDSGADARVTDAKPRGPGRPPKPIPVQTITALHAALRQIA